jgi:hypothetical protein
MCGHRPVVLRLMFNHQRDTVNLYLIQGVRVMFPLAAAPHKLIYLEFVDQRMILWILKILILHRRAGC